MFARPKLPTLKKKVSETNPKPVLETHTNIQIISTVSTPAPAHFVRFSTKERVLFAKRLSFLIKAGVSVLESTTIIRNQTKQKSKQRIYDTVIADVSAGQFLSKSLDRYKKIFGDFTVNIIRVGEEAGALPENLIYLAEELGKKHALERKVKSALIYPVFITIATFGVTGMLVVYIFPKIMPIFVSLNVDLPWTTRALLAVSEFLSKWGFLTILGLLFAIVVFEIAKRTIRPLRYGVDWFVLRLPIAGEIARSYNCANFCRTLSLSLKSGINLSEALHITADVTNNVVYKKAYLDFAEHVKKGEKISTAMTKYQSLFSDILPHMILIGETTGSLSNTLSYLSDLHEAEVDESTKNLSNSIEPILLITMGILVGIIAVSIIAPIYEVTKYIGTAR
jgi:type IV pilus assembly protein PilC